MRTRESVLALVWARDSALLSEAIEHLSHGLWPGRHQYEIGDVRTVTLGGPCPLRRDDTAVLDYELRDGWMWVLVPPATDPQAVAS